MLQTQDGLGSTPKGPAVSVLSCVVCGDSVVIDTSNVVATAQIITFVDAHNLHDRLSVELRASSSDDGH